MKTLPDNLEEWDDSYSNSDYVLPDGAEEALRAGTHYLAHTAWDHYGEMWFAGGKFYEQVWRLGVHVATVSADDLEELFGLVNTEYGMD